MECGCNIFLLLKVAIFYYLCTTMLPIILFLALAIGASAKPKNAGYVVSEVYNPDDRPMTHDLNAETKGRKFEGDIDINDATGASNRNVLTDAKKRWPEGKVCYFFDTTEKAIINNVNAAIKDFESRSCIRFHQRVGSEKNCIRVFKDVGCWSTVGMIGGVQNLSLQHPGCTGTKGVAIHEFMHALGFSHEQSREDRDEYITVNFENMDEGDRSQFTKAALGFSSYGFPYDLNSVMHYGMDYFSNNGKDTMTPKDPKVTKLGTRAGFTEMDLKKLNKAYCEGTKPPTFDKAEDITPYKQTIVDKMNGYRSKAGASNMFKLAWDDALAVTAATELKQCSSSEFETKNGNGILRVSHTSSYTDITKAFETVFADLDGTITGFLQSPNGTCCSAGQCTTPCTVERYMAPLYAAASKVGCAVGRCNGMGGQAGNAPNVHAVCVFDVAMPNIHLASPPFTKGTACSDVVGGKCENNLAIGGKVCVDNLRTPIWIFPSRSATCAEFVEKFGKGDKVASCKKLKDMNITDCQRLCGC